VCCGGGEGVVLSEMSELSELIELSEFGIRNKCRSSVFAVAGMAW
jgi:hypothetical protein